VTAGALKKFHRPTTLTERRYRALAKIFWQDWGGFEALEIFRLSIGVKKIDFLCSRQRIF
jgi:hypothetical protein